MSAGNGRDKSVLEPFVRAVESAGVLDGPADLAAGAVRSAVSPGALKDALSGTWLGHALHPALTDLVIGSFVGAFAVDVLAGESGGVAAERLIQLGMAAYLPTALAGASDWSDGAVDERVKRAGIVHAGGNAAALALFSGSLRARRRGSRRVATLLSGLGASVLTVGGYLGGHMSLRRGIGPDQTVFDAGSDEWGAAGQLSALEDGRPQRVVVDDTPVLLLRRGETVHAIHDRCSHRGCSLSEGTVEGDEVVCGCHSSRFGLRDGALLGGPATAPQPAFEVRVTDGALEVRRRAV